jgi:hypothetical protein
VTCDAFGDGATDDVARRARTCSRGSVTDEETKPVQHISQRPDGRFLARLVADDGRVVDLELPASVTTLAEAKRALADLRRVTPRRPANR